MQGQEQLEMYEIILLSKMFIREYLYIQSAYSQHTVFMHCIYIFYEVFETKSYFQQKPYVNVTNYLMKNMLVKEAIGYRGR